jgi:hypothetical protein
VGGPPTPRRPSRPRSFDITEILGGLEGRGEGTIIEVGGRVPSASGDWAPPREDPRAASRDLRRRPAAAPWRFHDAEPDGRAMRAPAAALPTEVDDEGPGRVEQPAESGAYVAGVLGPGQVAVNIVDGTREHPQAVVELVEAGSGHDDLALVKPAFDGPLAGLVVTLAAALAAVGPRTAGSLLGRQRCLAPAASTHRLPRWTPSRPLLRHCDAMVRRAGPPGADRPKAQRDAASRPKNE